MDGLSIIIPAHNAAACLEAAVVTAVAVAAKGGEVIVVDDGSTDGTLAVAHQLRKRFGEVLRVIAQSRSGASAARNSGIETASFPYMLFLDADDLLLPDGVAIAFRELMHSKCDMIVGFAIDKRETQLVPQNVQRRAGTSDLQRLVEDWWAVSTVIVKKGPLRWRDDLQVWEVIDFFARNLLFGHQVSYSMAYMTEIDHRQSLDRVTIRLDHYEPLRMASFFARLKREGRAIGNCDVGAASAIDRVVVSSLYRASRQGLCIRDSSRLLDAKDLSSYDWYKDLGPAGFWRLFGPMGLSLFAMSARVFRR